MDKTTIEVCGAGQKGYRAFAQRLKGYVDEFGLRGRVDVVYKPCAGVDEHPALRVVKDGYIELECHALEGIPTRQEVADLFAQIFREDFAHRDT